MPHDCAMLDFAWEPSTAQPITLIEINPFDPEKGLGHTSSLALFNWDEDGEQIRNGRDIEVRVSPVRSEAELEKEFNKGWPTVGRAARDALRRALQQLPIEDLEANRFQWLVRLPRLSLFRIRLRNYFETFNFLVLLILRGFSFFSTN